MDQVFGGDEQIKSTLREYDSVLAMIEIHLVHARAALAKEQEASFIDWEQV